MPVPQKQLDTSAWKPVDESAWKPVEESSPAPQMGSPAPTMGQQIGQGALNLGKGFVKGAGGTLNSIGTQLGKVPGLGSLLPQDVTDVTPEDMHTVPHGIMQNIGRGAEQIGEFMIPGGAEEAGATRFAQLAPRMGKLADPLARIATSALSSGAVNKAQGGNFSTGAVMGAGGQALGQGLKSVAPLMAESALGVRGPDRAMGRRIGQAILGETSGVNAGKIADQAKEKLSLYGDQLQNDALNSKVPVSLQPARDVAKNAYGHALARNEPSVIKDIDALNQQLGSRPGSPVTPQSGSWGGPYQKAPSSPGRVPIPASVPASEALALKRGVGDLVNSWNPATLSDFKTGATKQVYGALDQGIDKAVPTSAGLNQKMSTLMPVSARAGATDLNASALQRIMGRLTKPTGALTTGLGGATAGGLAGGPIGAALGFIGGVAAPELIGSPTSQMMMARGINSTATPKMIKSLTSLGLQADRKKGPDGKD